MAELPILDVLGPFDGKFKPWSRLLLRQIWYLAVRIGLRSRRFISFSAESLIHEEIQEHRYWGLCTINRLVKKSYIFFEHMEDGSSGFVFWRSIMQEGWNVLCEIWPKFNTGTVVCISFLWFLDVSYPLISIAWEHMLNLWYEYLWMSSYSVFSFTSLVIHNGERSSHCSNKMKKP